MHAYGSRVTKLPGRHRNALATAPARISRFLKRRGRFFLALNASGMKRGSPGHNDDAITRAALRVIFILGYVD